MEDACEDEYQYTCFGCRLFYGEFFVSLEFRDGAEIIVYRCCVCKFDLCLTVLIWENFIVGPTEVGLCGGERGGSLIWLTSLRWPCLLCSADYDFGVDFVTWDALLLFGCYWLSHDDGFCRLLIVLKRSLSGFFDGHLDREPRVV